MTRKRVAPTAEPSLHDRRSATGAIPGSPPSATHVDPVPSPAPTEAQAAYPTESHAFDPALLELARMQWVFGDWHSLSSIGEEHLRQHPHRAELALLACAACQQRGEWVRARSLAELARSWNCDTHAMAKLLLAGVHNSLARASLLLGLGNERAGAHFQHAVKGLGDVDLKLAERARVSTETAALTQALGAHPIAPPSPPVWATTLPVELRQSGLRSSMDSPVSQPDPKEPQVRRVAIHDLGLAWAGSTINTVIFRHHGVITHAGYQFTAFYVSDDTLRLVRRCLPTDEIDTFDLQGSYNLRDAHNSISLGVDRHGFVHMSYDHHGTQLKYRRSEEPLSIQAWTVELPMTGAHEERVTYPCFIQPPESRPDLPLMLLYRDGVWNRGTARLKVYDEAARAWTDRPAPVLSGADQKPWTSNAYWNHPVFGSDGVLHLSFVWRTDSLGPQQRINNINVCYAKSHDCGITWLTSLGQPYRLPITQVNAEAVHAVSPGSNLINQTSMALDSKNRPHVAFYSNDAQGIPQYQHLWFDGKAWHHSTISRRDRAFNLAGGGTLRIPISRPELLIDKSDNLLVIYRGDLTHDRMTVTRLLAPDYRHEAGLSATLWDHDLGFSEPIIDRIRWRQEELLTMLLQRNDQPDGDRTYELRMAPAMLIDFKIL